MTKGTEPAFPIESRGSIPTEPRYYQGLTKREYFAGQAIIGIAEQLSKQRIEGPLEIQWSSEERNKFYEWQAINAYAIADAMIKQGDMSEVWPQWITQKIE